MTEGQTQTVPAPTTPAPVAQVVAPQAPTQPTQLPSDSRDKTREQFEKLLESNKRLFEANEMLRKEIGQRQASNQNFAPIQAPQAPQVNKDEFTVVDPVTGEKYIDDQRLQARLSELQQKANKSEQIIQSYIKTTEDREIERQNREAFSAHPELNPADKEKFDPVFHKQVRGIILDSMYNPDEYGGRPLGFKDAGDLARTLYPKKAVASTAPVADEEKKKASAAAQVQKEQGSAQVPSQPQNAPQPTFDAGLEQLRTKTRYGDTNALAQRLLNTEHIVPKE